MMNTYARPVRDLRNNYNEIINLANEGNQIIITHNGKEAAVLIGTEAYREYESLLYNQYIKHELEKAKKMAKDPNTKWYTEEEVWAHFEDEL
ncbi:MAG: type II toxin-antitoxin system prevent-host-death family antitoxin [Oscillospiraceae bacterium]|nr:type II toxin-antitoxin system prevent-host-death family antitoxin [Oscillospiraceae bacterium]